ncbi:LRR receptor-like serine/threonine-protein kinase HSL2 [Ipomoea triloba]|uniref:LRR receptor-like serine/threonine-protein kinase HSL2 n=1 Tax=Ipomoea triloba TaxID=35885 RepID=UPI00125D52BF|nr:LRR receptor-like serine/threonine-protein kinase HSL2 [Ipomoea triloba]
MDFTMRLLIVLLFSAALVTPTSCSSRDVEVLLRVKTRQLGDSGGVLGDWNESARGAPCHWTGITCDRRSRAVVSINLGGLEVSGEFPADFCRISTLRRLNLSDNYFGGEINADSFSLCSHLEFLDISSNILVGELPELRREFSNLTTFDLQANNFSGEIPAGFFRMPKLRELYLVNNLFNGSVPESLSNLTELTHLVIAYNPFKPSPLPPSIGRLKKLQFLFAREANLMGAIPDSIGRLVNLRILDLSLNALSGKIPETIGGLKSAEEILLFGNQLLGELPDAFSNLTSLAFFDASQNMLTGRIPESLARLHLELLHLNDNDLEGEIPESLSLNPKLSDLKLFNNRLSGKLPENLGMNSELMDFDVSGNNLEGPLPPNLCSKKMLRNLILFNNRFSGSIPEPYGECSSMRYVRIQNNELSGKLPIGFWSFPECELFELRENKFEGTILPSISNAREMMQILISDNNFSGELPVEICELPDLVVMDMSRNRFSGPFPTCLTRLQNLQKLHLQENLMGGEIPQSVGSWTALTDLNLSFNQLTGKIPSSLGSLPVLNYLDLSWNMISGEIPASLTKLKLNTFNLSNNRLEGKVPSEFDNSFFLSSFVGNPGLCSSINFNGLPSCMKHRSTHSHLLVILAPCAVILVGLLICLLIKAKNLIYGRKRSKQSLKRIAFQKIMFKESELLASLINENIIARGGSGQVFRVKLKNGQMVAVKKLWEANRECESEVVFKAEVETLGSIRHKNIVKLLYGCMGKDFKILVYEYMENGSLGDVLHGEEGVVLDWPTRFNIAVGAAQGLAYLHHDCVPPILHRDIKSNNILLDKDFRPKVADFGLAKMLHRGAQVQESGEVMSQVAGSYGYIAPEYAYTLRISESSDVYSFGVVLLELISGKRPNDECFGDDNNMVKWASNITIEEERNGFGDELYQIVDPRMNPSPRDFEEIKKLLNVALLCTSAFPVDRPSMRRVVKLLKDISR